jgi:hypothetical protein
MGGARGGQGWSLTRLKLESRTILLSLIIQPTGGAGGLLAKLFHFYQFNRDEFMAGYHKRSNIESPNSMVMRKFGNHIRSPCPRTVP